MPPSPPSEVTVFYTPLNLYVCGILKHCPVEISVGIFNPIRASKDEKYVKNIKLSLKVHYLITKMWNYDSNLHFKRKEN